MAESCVMCEALNEENTTGCVAGCLYAPLVAQGVVTSLELKCLFSMYQPSYIHGFMTTVRPHKRPTMIDSFMFTFRKRMETPILSAEDMDQLLAKLAELREEEEQAASAGVGDAHLDQ
ncbi:putative transcription factor AS2-LOB family [Helianthus anomalus]